MFVYDKKLQYPVRIQTPNPKLASIIISQYGGPDGELGASLRYLSQRYSMPFPELFTQLKWKFRKRSLPTAWRKVQVKSWGRETAAAMPP